MKKKEKLKTRKEEKSFLEYITSHEKIITIVLFLCTALYPIINIIYKIIYQNECEMFYGLPGKYFNSNVDNRLLYLGYILILFLMCTVPNSIKKYGEKSRNLTKGYSLQAYFLAIVIGIEVGLFNVSNLIEIMNYTYKTYGFFRNIIYWLNKYAFVTITVVVVLGSVSVLGITLIDQIQNIKWKFIKVVVRIILFISFIFSFLMMLYGTIFKLDISINDKVKYEFVTIASGTYVVLSECDEKILLVPFEINKNGQYIFKTRQYMFIDKYDGTYKYKDVKYSPKVDLD